MAKEVINYPCDINVGDIMLTKDLREREIERIDGRYIYFTDGSQFSFRHPDLVGVVIKTKKRSTKKKEEE
jgi:hypothetical protein